MTGLEQRLRDVEGVSDIVIELSDDGLEGIRVRMNEGTDESAVLEEIRRILVAYGLKGSTRRRSASTSSIPELELEGDGDLVDQTAVDLRETIGEESTSLAETLPTETPQTETPPRRVSDLPEPAIIPAGEHLTVRLSDGARVVEAEADATPLGAADAMIRALCEWKGAAFPSRIAIDRLDIDGPDLVIIVARKNSMAGRMRSAATSPWP